MRTTGSSAAELEADAVIALGYDISSFADDIIEVIAYGTAVKLAD